tara:strand:- start:1429 stop:2340 length:912 start_codon:yes stop_codon:yes gene_type:complete
MASVTPIKIDGTNLKQISSSDGDTIRDRLMYLYLTDPSVALSVVANSGSLDAMSDTRMTAGAVSNSSTAFPNEATTAEPGTATVTFDKINQATATLSQPADTNNIRFPVYLDGSNNIKAMSYQDAVDTWINAATTSIIAAQPYKIHTSTTPPSGYTIVSSTPVFVDTRANTSLYTAGGIGETLDQPQDITSYYLHKANGTAVTVTGMPLYIDSNQNLKEYTVAELDVILKEIIRYTTINTTNQRIRYYIGGSGTTLGTGMANTKLNGSGNYQTLQVGDDYRAQEFPNGSVVTEATYYLKARKE